MTAQELERCAVSDLRVGDRVLVGGDGPVTGFHRVGQMQRVLGAGAWPVPEDEWGVDVTGGSYIVPAWSHVWRERT